MKDYRTFIDEKVRDIARLRVIVDVGGGERFQKWLAPYKSLFAHADYKTLDYSKASGADVVGDIHAIPLPDASVDAVICASVLEHVKDPMKAMGEIQRILRPGGVLFLHVPSTYPYHARKGVYPDYWRFFDDTVTLMLEGFSKSEVVKRGGYFTALSFFVPLQHRARFLLDPLARVLDRVFRTGERTTTAGYYIYASK